MNNSELAGILSEDFFRFIDKYFDEDSNILRLKKWNNQNIDVKFAILQMECRHKMAYKVPDLAQNSRFIYPSKLLVEQCTSQQIAEFHSTLFDGCNIVVDLTAGLCIDAYYISKVVKKVVAVELEAESAEIDEYNMKMLGANVAVVHADCREYIKCCTEKFDGAFIDPARRGDNNSRVFDIEQCSPDVVSMLPDISNHCNFIIIKASPMIDITQTIRQLGGGVSDVWIISIKNECKELLFKKKFDDNHRIPINVHTLNYDSLDSCQRFDYEMSAHKNTIMPEQIMPIEGMYLYEPNASIMKSGGFEYLQSEYLLAKLHSNTHLFISDELHPTFPGRIFNIGEVVPYKSHNIKAFASRYPQINVAARNIKITAQQLKEKLKVKDGGNMYLFGVTAKDDSRQLLICNKININ